MRIMKSMSCITTLILAMCSCGKHDPADYKYLIGKTESYVLGQLGDPDKVAHYDSTTIDPSKHSASEVKKFDQTTTTKHLEYGDIIIKINLSGNVHEVTK